MPSRQNFEIQRLRQTSRAAGLGWPGDALLRQYILLYFEPFLSLLSPHEGQVPGWDLPRSPHRSWWAPGWLSTLQDVSSQAGTVWRTC